jgi:hypothetical protein
LSRQRGAGGSVNAIEVVSNVRGHVEIGIEAGVANRLAGQYVL